MASTGTGWRIGDDATGLLGSITGKGIDEKAEKRMSRPGGLSSERIDDLFHAFHDTGENRDISFHEPASFCGAKVHDEV